MRKKLALNESIIEEKTIKAEDIDAFAKVSGDNNILLLRYKYFQFHRPLDRST